MKYIIDGYNVIHKIDELKGKRLRSQREGLIRILENAQAANRRLKDLTVVFDGKSAVFAPRISSAVKVIFTKDKSADRKIKEILESSTFTRDITVVSDDRQIRFYAGALKAKRLSVGEFLEKIYSSYRKKHTFKLDEIEVKRINQELEKIWLPK